MRLEDYPKPRNDNGRGIHWVPYTWGQVADENKRVTDDLVQELVEMNMRWVLILNGDGQEWRANEYLVRKLVGPDLSRPNIMPIIRIGTHFDADALAKRARGEQVGLDLNRVREIVAFYRALGVPYFQLYNEPNHIDEWPDHVVPMNAPEICMALWADAALATIDAGGLPGFPPPAPGASWPGGDDLVMMAVMLDKLDARLTVAQRAKLYDKMWVGIHNYFLWRPVLSLPADSHGFKKFVWYEGIIAEKLGRQLPILTGEGGLRMGPPPYGDNANEAQVADSSKEACRYMARAPKYYFCNCFWLMGSAIGGGSMEWENASWFRKDRPRQEAVTALKRLGEFQRNPEPPEEWFFYRNGYPMHRCHLVQGAMLRKFQALGGVSYCGYPTSGEAQEGALVVQGFEKLTLERWPNGEVKVRGQGPREITIRIPSVAALLTAQGLAAKDVERALAEVTTLYGPPEALVAGEYQVQLPGPSSWRNQDVINAFWIASGRTSFEMLSRAGLDVATLAADRPGAYAGAAIADLPGLTQEERELVLAALPPLTRRLVTFRIPGLHALLEAQGLESEAMTRALRLMAAKYGPAELMVPGAYSVSIPPEPEMPSSAAYTNQEIINAFYTAGGKTWTLLNKAGLNLLALASDRAAPYAGPAVDEMATLTDEERAWVKAALPLKLATPATMRGMMAPLPLTIKWEPAAPENYVKGRAGHPIDLLVIHATGAGWRGTLERARQVIGGASPHYVIDRDGTIYQLVRDQDAARHVLLLQPAAAREALIQPNARSLGVALVNWGQAANEAGEMRWDPYTAEQYASLRELVSYLCKTYRVPRRYPPLGPAAYAPAEQLVYFRGIIGASALDRAPSSPGPQFDWERIG